MKTEVSLSDIKLRSSIQIALSLQPTATLGNTEYLNEIRLIKNSLVSESYWWCNHTPRSRICWINLLSKEAYVVNRKRQYAVRSPTCLMLTRCENCSSQLRLESSYLLQAFLSSWTSCPKYHFPCTRVEYNPRDFYACFVHSDTVWKYRIKYRVYAYYQND